MEPTTSIVAGIDPSLTAPGMTVLGAQQRSTTLGTKGTTQLPLAERTYAVAELATAIVDWVTTTRQPDNPRRVLRQTYPALVLLEAPDVSRSYGGLVERVNLTYEITKQLLDLGVPVGHVPSAVLKGYATGKGGGKIDGVPAKQVVLCRAQQTWPQLGIADTDQADSAWLAAMALDVLGLGRSVPDEQAEQWLYRSGIQYPPTVRQVADAQ